MADPVFQKTEYVGTSAKSFYEAAANAVARAAQDLPKLSWFEVVEQRGNIVDGKIHQYQVTVKVGHRLDG